LATLNAVIVDCFEFDKSAVPNNYRALLDSKAEILNRYPNVTITAIGHTDNIGTDAYNDALGKRRAEAVKAYLVSKGVSASRIITDTRGEKSPVVPNNSEANRCKNRRVEFSVRY
jgi:OOP family OmpA-OmpF porin